MKTKKILLYKVLMVLFLSLVFMNGYFTVYGAAPYNTYTSDSDGRIIPSPEAYTPIEQISSINGERLRMPEHVFVDNEDYIYITDSGNNKIYILDPQYKFYRELISDKFFFIKSTFVTKDMIYVIDGSRIYIFDKNTLEFIREIDEPDSPIFKEGYKFRPTHIAVDIRGNIYVRSTGSTNGLMMLNSNGDFLTFFGANPLQIPIVDRIRAFFLTEKQQKKLERVFPDVPTNIAIDKKGFIYTVTSSININPVKKFNVSGTNFFSEDLIATYGMVSIWVGQYSNVFGINSDGWVFEYDSTGNLIFLFGGKDFNSSRLGLLNRPVSIATNSQNHLIVIDQGTKLIQTYQTTEFTDAVHQAIAAYNDGNYSLSKDLWEYTLKYNSLFDLAHIGLGDAYFREGNYAGAYREYKYAKHYTGISSAFWEIRQKWLENNLNTLFLIILLLLIIRYTWMILNKKYHYSSWIKNKFNQIKKNRIIDQILYVFVFLRNPLDELYEIKTKSRVSRITATVMYILYLLVFVVHKKYTNEIFVPKYYQNLVYDLLIIIIIFTLWLISNYLICSIRDGEGTFVSVYNATAYVLSPIVIIMPPLILVSNFFTLEQVVFYVLPIHIMFIWILFLMFFMIKDINNYEVGETNSVIFISIFTMLIIGLFIFVCYTIGNQLLTFIYEIITEVVSR